MGLSELFVAAPAAALHERAELEPLGTHDRWRYARAPLDSDLDALSAAIARSLGAPTIAGFVFDDDFGEIAVAWPEGTTSSLDLRARRERQPLGGQWLDPAAQHKAIEQLVEWAAAFAPRAPTADEIAATLATVRVFAQGAVIDIFRLLGLGDLGPLVFAYRAPAAEQAPNKFALEHIREHRADLPLAAAIGHDRTWRRAPVVLVWPWYDDKAEFRAAAETALAELDRRGLTSSVVGAPDEQELERRVAETLAERRRFG